MDLKKRSSSSKNELQKKIASDQSSSMDLRFEQNEKKWEDPSILDYGVRIEQPFSGLNQPSEIQSSPPCNSYDQLKIPDRQDVRMNETPATTRVQDWDHSTMLNNLSFLEQKIHQLQDLVHVIVGCRGQVLGRPDELVVQQQQLIIADLTSIIVQLITTAGSLLPSAKDNISMATPIGQLGGIVFPAGTGLDGGALLQNNGASKFSEPLKPNDVTGNCGAEQNYNVEDHEAKDEEGADEGENLPPGSYEILQLEKEEILAPHTHFCTICGKGFKRDANLRMHMRGHGDEYKTPEALAKPNKESSSEPMLIKRYSCPYFGCKRNKDHKKFQPLKTILCVKNHYKRTHCDKSFICSRCNTKKFSVIADLKTHEKHCGKDKWLCSCGTTFSRKDKLFGHVALFQGHTPAIPLDETKLAGASDLAEVNETSNNIASFGFNFDSNAVIANRVQTVMDMKGSVDDPTSYFSPLRFDTCNFSGFHEFPRPPFDDSENSLSYLLSGSCNYARKAGGDSNYTNIEP